MTLLESLVLAVIHGLSRFLPLGAEAHEKLLQQTLGWPAAEPVWKSTFAVGSLLALLVFFIHDWASILSSFLQLVFGRKKPMTFDERFPFFLIFCTALPAGTYWYLKEQMGMDPELLPEPFFKGDSSLLLLGGMAVGAGLLWFAGQWSKRTRGLFDLDILDSLIFGLGQCLGAIPGLNGSTGMMSLALLRNYHLEAATKLVGLFSLPLVSFEAGRALSVIDWHSSAPISGSSWLQWLLCVAVSAAATFFGLRVLTDQIRKNGYGRWIGYRLLVSVVLLGLHFWAA